MNKFFIVLSHTFLTNVRTKSFKLTTILTAIFILVAFNLPTILSNFDSDDTTRIGFIDQTKAVYPLYQEQMSMADQNMEIIELKDEEEAKQELTQGKIKGYLIINEVQEGKINATYKSFTISESGLINKLEAGLNQVQFRLLALNIGLSAEQATKLFQSVTLDRIPLDEQAKSEEEMIQSTALVYLLLFAMYFSVLMYGNMVATEVAKEKSTRIMEILISSVNPVTQMFGKIIGIALLGLFQAGIFVIIGYISMQFGEKSVELGGMMLDFSNIPAGTIVYAIVFFLLGYLLFATLSAMLGSLVNKIEELNQMVTPLNFIIIIAFMLAMFGLGNPKSIIIIIASYIPVFTPMIMFLRVGLDYPAMWEIVLSIAILIITIIGLAFLAAKVYRGGVLMYGKGASLKDIKKALTFHKN